ncbi:MAG TPA: MarC family protein [bacterium]|nr:NAAT family transporter [Myxococcales bacterium]HQC51090.1 MarC family protein [bacterium]HQG12879.1 MarC family protein [bacterium]HQH80611.1 MarC family protein [bacterium]
MTILSATILLLLVLDPLGNIPLFISALSKVPKRKRVRIILRESLIALLVLIFFLFFGKQILTTLYIDEPSLGIAGGVILFLIAIRMIFPVENVVSDDNEEPFIVPLAIPLIAGPSAIATVLLFTAKEPQMWGKWLVAVCGAWAISTVILSASSVFNRFLGGRGLAAMERLMGMILATISVQMLMTGIAQFLAQYRS